METQVVQGHTFLVIVSPRRMSKLSKQDKRILAGK